MQTTPNRIHWPVAVLALLLSGCYMSTQRYPGPMVAAVDPLPPGTTDLYPAGPEEVLVLRIADPVHVRRPGESSSFPLYFYSKQARMNAGSWVFCGAGGRAEVIFAGNSTIRMMGHGSGVVGSPSRDEPLFFFHEMDTAVVTMNPGEQVRLLGGIALDADGGPFVIEREGEEIMRVRNRSQVMGRIAYREEVFHLSPGDVIDLPLLGAGAAPREEDPGFQTMAGGSGRLQVRGDVSVVSTTDAVILSATGDHEIVGFGLRVRLNPGDEIRIDDFSKKEESEAEPPLDEANEASEADEPDEATKADEAADGSADNSADTSAGDSGEEQQ